jgi:hypothetical protein
VIPFVAQGLPDPAAAAGLLAQAEIVVASARTWIRTAGPEGWLTMGGAGLFMIWLWGRRP